MASTTGPVPNASVAASPLAPAREHGTMGEVITFLVMAGFFAAAPTLIYPLFLMKVLCFALFACAFNLLIGYVGLLSFGHALFFGWASYVSAYAAKSWGLPPELAILLGGGAAAGLGVIAGALAIRRQGIYFAMITLALAQMMYFFALQAPFTGGEDGIQAVPRGKLFGYFDLSDPTTIYVFVLVLFLACFLLIHRIIHSPFGEVLKAIRENEARAISLGYKTERYKLVAFVLSATMAGVAGATKAIVFQLASLTDVHWTMSGEVVLMTLVGGLGTVFGPVVGAFIIVWMENYLAQYGQWVTVIEGVVFVACVLLFRRGIVGTLTWAVAGSGAARPIPAAVSPPAAATAGSQSAAMTAISRPAAAISQAPPSESYFARHWRGELSLGRSYWLNGVLIAVLGRIIWIAGIIAIRIAALGNPVGQAIPAFILMAVFAGIYVWQVVGVWRSADHHVERGGKNFWAILAKISVGLGVLLATITVFTNLGVIGQVLTGGGRYEIYPK